jgi:hypothetical protein
MTGDPEAWLAAEVPSSPRITVSVVPAADSTVITSRVASSGEMISVYGYVTGNPDTEVTVIEVVTALMPPSREVSTAVLEYE